jgi:hypothetical protein
MFDLFQEPTLDHFGDGWSVAIYGIEAKPRRRFFQRNSLRQAQAEKEGFLQRGVR